VVTVLRWAVVGLLVVHALIHLLGAVKGFGLATVERLKEPVGAVAGAGWLLAAALVLTAAVMIAFGAPTWWWAVAGGAAVVSQIMIVTSWSDARAGTVPNVILLIAAVIGFGSSGPASLRAAHSERVRELVAAAPAPEGIVSEADLAGLPAPVARYVRRSGAIGRPRVTGFTATFHGRIRSDADSAWMSFTGRQLNAFGSEPQRLFLISATRAGLPVTVFHDYHAGTATMRGRLIGLVPIIDASGPEMDRSETVTVLNDIVVFAPAAIVDAPIDWTAVDDTHVRARYRAGGHTVQAELVFDGDGDLVDFVSDDRSRASGDGRSFTQARWSTPLGEYRETHGRRWATGGEGRWSGDGDEFAYITFTVEDVVVNPWEDDGL